MKQCATVVAGDDAGLGDASGSWSGPIHSQRGSLVPDFDVGQPLSDHRIQRLFAQDVAAGQSEIGASHGRSQWSRDGCGLHISGPFIDDGPFIPCVADQVADGRFWLAGSPVDRLGRGDWQRDPHARRPSQLNQLPTCLRRRNRRRVRYVIFLDVSFDRYSLLPQFFPLQIHFLNKIFSLLELRIDGMTNRTYLVDY